MLLDILAVLVVSLVSSLLLCTTSLHGLPPPPTHYIHNRPSAESLSSFRHLSYPQLSSVDDDIGDDDSEMLIGESNESPTLIQSSTNGDDDDSTSSADGSNEPLDLYLPTSSKSLSRKLLFSQHHQTDQHKRSSSPSSATNFNFNSAAAAAALADASTTNNADNLSQLSDSTRLSPSLKIMVETNPFARAWLALLLQKMMQEQPVPYIFKYGRRRKK